MLLKLWKYLQILLYNVWQKCSVTYCLMYEFLGFPPYKGIFTFSSLLFSWKEKCIKLFPITFFHWAGKIQRNTTSLNDMQYTSIVYLRSSVQIKINKGSQKKVPKDLSSAWCHFPAYTSFYPNVMFCFSFCSAQHFCLRKILLSHYQHQPNRLFKNRGENKGCGF